jgi:hypothetical protein|tara:strand:- start:165 stop:491 length:327 start_codon:yes stop_codon:yes gene_type:complete
MRKGDKRKFEDKELLKKLIKLYKEEWYLNELSLLFKADRTSIIYRLQKHGVELRDRNWRRKDPTPKIEKKQLRVEIKPHKKGKYDHITNAPTNRGKNYKEYINKNSSK